MAGHHPSLEEGLRKMAAWVKTVGSRNSKESSGIEIRKGVSPPWVSPDGRKVPRPLAFLMYQRTFSVAHTPQR